MSDTVIKVENLSKLYRLGVWGTGSLKDDIKKNIAKWTGRNDPTAMVGSSNHLDTVDQQEVWALKDINFEVKEGEVVGIIGKNGAGKSTLLKILSEITAPSTGAIKIKGRVASLLEVGTGMHLELTGRENIFLNGAILGMRRWEIKSKFEEIVDFAGIAKYIDTPIKRYSSGMRVRLGFAIAAFLEPEILVVDEVLAVGDAEFQKRAIGKMQEVSLGQGRTVLFVSHNMASVEALCNKGILLKDGKLESEGSITDIIEEYRYSGAIEVGSLAKRKDRKGDGRFQFLEIEMNANKGVVSGKELIIKINYLAHEDIARLYLAITFCRSFEDRLMVIDNLSKKSPLTVSKGHGTIEISIDKFSLLPHQYEVNLWASDGHNVMEYITSAISISAMESDIHGSGFNSIGMKHGFVIPDQSVWKISQL